MSRSKLSRALLFWVPESCAKRAFSPRLYRALVNKIHFCGFPPSACHCHNISITFFPHFSMSLLCSFRFSLLRFCYMWCIALKHYLDTCNVFSVLAVLMCITVPLAVTQSLCFLYPDFASEVVANGEKWCSYRDKLSASSTITIYVIDLVAALIILTIRPQQTLFVSWCLTIILIFSLATTLTLVCAFLFLVHPLQLFKEAAFHRHMDMRCLVKW